MISDPSPSGSCPLAPGGVPTYDPPPALPGTPGLGDTRVIEVVQAPGTAGGVTINLTGTVDDEDW